MKMTSTERKFFREAVIREYKNKHPEIHTRRLLYKKFVNVLKRMVLLNVAIGVSASVVLVWLRGWNTFINLMLSGIIWITLISTVLSAFLKKK
jgi:hypothetical protein